MKIIFVLLSFLMLFHGIFPQRPVNARRSLQLKRQKVFEPVQNKYNLTKEYRQYLLQQQASKCNEARCEIRYGNNETFVMQRQRNFLKRAKAIEKNNKLFEQGNQTFRQRPMRWTDWDKERKFKALCGTRRVPQYRNAPPQPLSYLKTCKGWKAPPVELNKCEFPNPIRDQMDCGCCWAFSTIQSLEAAVYQCFGKKIELSVQQLVDCDFYNSACDGGWPSVAFYKLGLEGVCSWRDYFYVNEQQERCRQSSCKKVVNPHFIYKQMEVELNGDEECLKKIIERVGPVIVAVHADEEFMVYGDGYYQNPSCPKDDPNHAMVVCGWGSDARFGEYWLVRNSWGQDWGENGYVRIKTGNTCGISSWAMWPVIQSCSYLDIFETQTPKT